MSRFVNQADLKTIVAPWWDDGEQVIIKRFSYGDRQKIAGTAAKVGLSDEGAKLTDIAVDKVNMTILELGIKSWTLKDGDGKVLQPTQKNLYRLQVRDGDFILAQINEYNPRRSAEQQDNFRA